MATTQQKKSTQQRKSERRQFAQRLPKGPNGGVQLLLIQSVDHLGAQGDIIEVRPGYANNYLIPQGLATVATDHHVRMVEKHKAKLLEIERARLASYRELANTLSRQTITIEANANDEGHLYGSVGVPEIVAGLKELKFSVSADQVRVDGVFKELGIYNVKIQLHNEVSAEVKVFVTPTES
ncbi:MAG: 50S ribosomal protein L9 [Pirellulaceae bacterium]|nr:50S ribosomal protein L9 [Pirellulaceae bacterium]